MLPHAFEPCYSLDMKRISSWLSGDSRPSIRRVGAKKTLKCPREHGHVNLPVLCRKEDSEIYLFRSRLEVEHAFVRCTRRSTRPE